MPEKQTLAKMNEAGTCRVLMQQLFPIEKQCRRIGKEKQVGDPSETSGDDPISLVRGS